MAVSGIRVLSYNKFTRRDRFVMAAALSFGFGNLLVPGIFEHLFDGVQNPSAGLEGLFNSITIVLSTPCEFDPFLGGDVEEKLILYCVVLSAGICAVILNLLLPQEVALVEGEEDPDADVDVVEEVEKGNHPSSIRKGSSEKE